MEGGGVAPELAAEAFPIFREGICLVLSNWTALQTAVENEWGGRDSRCKSDQLASDVFSYFTLSKEPLYIDDLENILDEAMLSLNTMAEDGSIEEVAEKLMIMHGECLEGDYQSIEKLRETHHQAVARPHVRQVVNDDDDDSSDDEDSIGDDDTSKMMVDAPESQSNANPVDMSVDERRPKEVAEAEDGWEVVGPRKYRGRRK